MLKAKEPPPFPARVKLSLGFVVVTVTSLPNNNGGAIVSWPPLIVTAASAVPPLRIRLGALGLMAVI